VAEPEFESQDRDPVVVELEREARSALEWPVLLEYIAGQARSEPGRERLLVLAPAPTLDEARERMARVAELLDLESRGSELPLATFPEIGPTLSRVRLGASGSGSELVGVAKVLDRARELRGLAREHAESHPTLCACLQSDPKLDRPLARLLECLDLDGSVRDSASPELARARARVREVQSELKRRLTELVRRYADVIQGDYYTEREGRYVLPVRSDAHYRVEGMVLGSSGSGGTLFVEPREVSELGNRLRVREAEVERETAIVLSELSLLVRERLEPIAEAFEAAVCADMLGAIASFALRARARAIQVSADARFELRSARHPLMCLSDAAIVPNDIVLDSGRALVISGPNAGGKTVTLKCLGLFAWMARAGIPIPVAEESTVGWFDLVLADVGDEQSLARSLSTFSAHVTKLARILDAAAPHVLVLLDEVAAGTDPEEGAVLAAAILEALARRGAAVVVTTHYERLKELATTSELLANASVGFDFAAMRPTFRLKLGEPGASSALAVAQTYGLPASLLERARALLPTAALDRERALHELSSQNLRLEARAKALEAERARLDQEAADLVLEREAVERAARARIEQETTRLMGEVRSARAELKELRDRLRNAGSDDERRQLERGVNRVAAQVAVGGPLAPAPKTKAVTPIALPELVPGARVRLLSNGAIATVLEAPSRGEVRLRVGSVRVTERVDQLSALPAGGKSEQSSGRRPASASRAAKASNMTASTPRLAEVRRTTDNTLDLRGVRVEAAPAQLDAFLDRLLGEGEPVGFVLHGHGTGALRSVVRQHLGSSTYIEQVRAAEAEEGGDAFTLFWTR
jgi:DNA mismatch repair protein MutS2